MIPVILSGGSGTRLWPISRTKLPKQFNMILDESLQALTMKRAKKLGTPWIITGQSLKDLTEKQKRSLGMTDIQCIYEPLARNTAPAIALITHLLSQKGLDQEIVSILPADQLIEKEDQFVRAMHLATQLAKNGKVVTLGIKPTEPATGFGYIQSAPNVIQRDGEFSSYPVLKFHEKPSEDQAKAFIKQGNFNWNAGIFIFQIAQMRSCFEKYQPKIWSQIKSIRTDLSNLKAVYSDIENISIDYAIMEKLSEGELACIPGDFGWNDIGSWDAIAKLGVGASNSTSNPIATYMAEGNFVFPVEDKTYAISGLNDLIVVDTKDALLICPKGTSQDVKFLVNQLKETNPKIVEDHIFEERPWGKYEVLRDTSYFKSKSITVDPGCQLSYQSHSKREEFWIIVRGEGELWLDNDIINVKRGSNIKIPCGAKHRIKNVGSELLEFIEVQIGTYFGEDDIVRYKDDYNREVELN